MIRIVCQRYIVALMIERENCGPSVHHFEWHLFGSGVDGRVIVECDQWQLLIPVRFAFVRKSGNLRVHCRVVPFDLTIGLRVIRGRVEMRDANVFE